MSFDNRHELDTTKGVRIDAVSQNGLVAVLMAQGTDHSSVAALDLLRSQGTFRQV